MSPAPPAKPRKKRKRSKDKGVLLQGLEYAAALSVLGVVRCLPFWACRWLAAAAGDALFFLAARRRRIARTNLRIAFPEMDEAARVRLARASCRSLVLTGLEGAKVLYRFDPERTRAGMMERVEGAAELLARARRLHDEAGGCVFVVPHLGNWEYLAHTAALAGIPLTITVRPLDNARLERRLFGVRAGSGQQILSKRNAFYHLREALRRGRSVGILADQHAGMRGIDVPFFGRPASTTTAPAVLALHFRRPIVLVACVRKDGGRRYEAFVGEPIRPDPDAGAREEVERLTRAVSRETEALVRRWPEQYLWLHDRWKLTKHWGRSEAPPHAG